MKKQNITLYNVFFPIWLLLLIPTVWLVVLPANLLIDGTVVLLTLLWFYNRRKHADLPDGAPTTINAPGKKQAFREMLRCILPVWIFGFISDLLGAGFMLFWGYIPGIIGGDDSWWTRLVTDPISLNPFKSPLALLFTLLGVGFAGLMIYFLNNRFSFRRVSISDDERKKLALSLAVFTAPYVMLIPSEWFWN